MVSPKTLPGGTVSVDNMRDRAMAEPPDPTADINNSLIVYTDEHLGRSNLFPLGLSRISGDESARRASMPSRFPDRAGRRSEVAVSAE